jgi:fructose-1,6-bisphosphatase/inositol monophosphatase family enzyme
MNVEEMPDPILRALANVRPIASSMAHDDRVRARCHDALERRRRVRSARARALDMALAAAVAIYAAIGVTEAAWLVFGSG